MDKKNTLKIVKIGGNVIDNPQALTSFLTTFSSLKDLKFWCMAVGNRPQPWQENRAGGTNGGWQTHHRRRDFRTHYDGLCG